MAEAPYVVGIHGSSMAPVHQSERYFPGGTLETPGYRIPLPTGSYRVALHFTEIFDGITGPGQRVFDVVIENEKRLAGYGVFARVGYSTPDCVELPVTVNDGHLDIQFIERIELPKITAVEVTRVDGE